MTLTVLRYLQTFAISCVLTFVLLRALRVFFDFLQLPRHEARRYFWPHRCRTCAEWFWVQPLWMGTSPTLSLGPDVYSWFRCLDCHRKAEQEAEDEYRRASAGTTSASAGVASLGAGQSVTLTVSGASAGVVTSSVTRAVGTRARAVTNPLPIQEVIAPPSVLPRADLAGPILAYRQWCMEDVWLRSIIVALRWPHGEPLRSLMAETYSAQSLRAVLVFSTSAAGVAAGAAGAQPGGIYASKRWELLDFHQDRSHVVTGQVALWGRVVEHEYGYRAEYAYPYTLFLPPASPARVPAMAGFPVVPESRVRQVLAVASAYGIPAIPQPPKSPFAPQRMRL